MRQTGFSVGDHDFSQPQCVLPASEVYLFTLASARVSRDGRNYSAADAAKSVLAPSALVGDNRGGCLETDARLRKRPNSCRSASQGANEPGSCDVRPSRRRRDSAACNDERRRRLDVLEIDLRCRAWSSECAEYSVDQSDSAVASPRA